MAKVDTHTYQTQEKSINHLLQATLCAKRDGLAPWVNFLCDGGRQNTCKQL